MGRRKLFTVTLGIYLIGGGLTAATAGAGAGWVAFLYLTRFSKLTSAYYLRWWADRMVILAPWLPRRAVSVRPSRS